MSKHDDDKPKAPAGPPSPERRSFFTTAANLAMAVRNQRRGAGLTETSCR